MSDRLCLAFLDTQKMADVRYGEVCRYLSVRKCLRDNVNYHEETIYPNNAANKRKLEKNGYKTISF